ncbi:MAG: hypothetical protein ACRD2T_16575 [Thermoanaerobaculia bacterium]
MTDFPVEGMVQTREPKRRGCFFWGCLTVLILLALIGGCVGLFGFKLIQLAKQYTSTQPQPIPLFEPRPGQAREVQDRIDAFAKSADAGGAADLALSAEDLNAWLSSNREFRGKVYARIEGDQVLFDVSIPVGDLPIIGPFLKGRYFNGTLGVKPEIRRGELQLYPETAVVAGESLPEEAMKRLRREDLLRNTQDRDFFEFARAAKSIEVRDGKVVLKR